MVLNLDLAPSIVDLCGVEPLPQADGRSWKPLLNNKPSGWRTSFFYEYNYEAQFPYTPNVRAIRTAEWKYIHYPTATAARIDTRPNFTTCARIRWSGAT